MDKSNNLFIVWKIYQRRAESLAAHFDLNIIYYHYKWEERHRLFKALSYVLKSFRTCIDIIRYRPKLIFLQLPPTPALYIVGLYTLLTGRKFVADCHNAMIMDWWAKWPFVKKLLNSAEVVLLHNSDINELAIRRYNVNSMVMHDPLPIVSNIERTSVLEKFGLKEAKYVIVPWNLASDEPIAEFVEGIKQLPQIKFAMTWFAERMPENIVDIPPNLIFTGFLEVSEFNDLFNRAGAAISLTTQAGTQPSAGAESLALGIPFILSDSETARQLYSEAAVFVDNTPSSIANGLKDALARQKELRDCVVHLKQQFENNIQKEIDSLKCNLSDFI